MSSLLISAHLYEKRPLKKPKLGPPDVYPQDPKQKEDELTALNVKHGYNSATVIQDEYGTARNANITSNRFGEYFSAILSKKHELNTFSDTSRKKQQINKDSTLYVTSKTKNYVDTWFKDLATNGKPLSHLSRKVPVFNKKEEIFTTLYEFNVPMIKAEWFIKLSSAHQMAMSESNNKSKKRQMPDPSQEWTACLCKFLKEHYIKIVESVNHNSTTVQNIHSTQVSVSTEELLNQWNYFTRLAQFLYEDYLLDRHDFLSWLLELFEKIKSIDDPMLNIVVPLLVHYIDEFTQSEFLSRRVAYYSAKKISQLVIEYNVELHMQTEPEKENISNSTNHVNNEKTPTKSSIEFNSNLMNNIYSSENLATCFKEIISCSKHRNILFGLSTIIQVITIDCTTALVWLNYNSFSDSGSIRHQSTLLQGSPLDYLPCEPSNLPMAPCSDNEIVRNRIRSSENLIRHRSTMSERKWFFRVFNSVYDSKFVGNIVNRLLNVLDCLDKHVFDKVSSSNCLDSLYSKIFNTPLVFEHSASHNTINQTSSENGHDSFSSNGTHKSISHLVEEDVPIVRLLCEWAVTSKRFGEHRSRIVAKLLEKRQNTLLSDKEQLQNDSKGVDQTQKENEESNIGTDSKQPTGNNTSNSTDAKSNVNDCNTPVYQTILFEFLDLYAPVYEDKRINPYSNNSFNSINSSPESKHMFNNLIVLFSELIRHEIFSHDAYMCTLISRGLFTNHPNTAIVNFTNLNHSNKNNAEDSLTGLVPSLSNIDSVSNGGLIGSSLHKSTSSSSLPMFDPLSNNSTLNSNEQSSGNWFSLNNDNVDEDLDDDLDKILQHIKAGQQSLNDQTDILIDPIESDKEDEPNGTNSSNTNNVANSTSLSDFPGVSKNSNAPEPVNTTSRHLLYTLHFPLPQDEFFVHECNQRHILLYGVGKTKDEAKHSVKKVNKEIQKLFNRKSSMDISDGGKVKKHAIKEGFNFENAIAKFQNLSIFDQHSVTNSCASTVLEMLNGVVMGSANHLPLIESIAFLFDLMEIALNIYGLIEFIVQMLKELVEVEIQLQQKCPLLARPYCTSIGLYIVGVLNRYHNYVIASNEDIGAVFDGLWKLVRHVSTPADCSSAERCIIYYIHDLYSSCSHVLKKYHDIMSPIISKIKAMSNLQNEASSTPLSNTCIMMEYLKNPKLKVDSAHISRLNENASDRYSLVFNAICCISEANDMDYLNELSVLCAELTASCSLMSIEWFSAFKALCDQVKTNNNYSSLLTKINIGDRTIYDNLAIFASILAARRCFCLEEFIYHVCLPSLLIPTYHLSDEAERGARLSCHLTLYLFKYYDSPLAASNSAMNSSFASSSRYSLTSPGPLCLSTVTQPIVSGQKPLFVIKYACDRYLLGGVLNSLRIELIVTVLKAIFMLEMQIEKRVGEKGFKSEKSEMNYDSIIKPMPEDDFGDMNLLGQISSKPKLDSIDKPSLYDFAKHVLRQICMQDWVHDRCLRGFMVHSETFKLLLDKRFTHKDSQYLLNMICYHKQILPPSAFINDKSDSKQIIRLFQNLDEWSIRISWLQLFLIYEQLASNNQSQSSSEVSSWLETLSRAVVEYFQQSSQIEPTLEYKNLTLFTSKSSTVKTNALNFSNNISTQNERIWLLAPLISKLPHLLQSKIMRATSDVFDSSSWILFSQSQSGSLNSKSKAGFQGSKNSLNSNGIVVNSQNYTSVLLSYQPFISLLLLCLNSKEDCKDSVLNSIYIQISQCINEKLSDDIRMKHSVQEGLQLRFSLVGAMFNIIQSSSSSTNDWSIMLLQLISFSIVDPHINYENFTTVLDMLTSLMHSTQISSSSPEQREESKKQNQNLIKKMKKELNIERVGLGVCMAKQLLPLVKLQADVIACEPMGSLVDTKGNKIAGFDSIDKKQGLQVAEKQKLSPWDLIEGFKNPAPLSFSWFGGIKMERKPTRLEENFHLLSRHKHNILKPTSYYIEQPPLPPEDDPPPQPPMMAPNMQSFPYANTVLNSNMPNISMQNSHQPNISPQTPQSFNSPMMHHMGQVSANNFHSSHLHMPPIAPNNLPHGIPQANPPMLGQPQMMTGNNVDHQMSQPPHHLMMNSVHPAPLSSGSIVPMRPPIGTGPPMPPMPPMPPVVPVNTRAAGPKKAKAQRKRRAVTKNQPVNGVPSGQQTPPIRMANTFDTYNQPASVNNPQSMSQPPTAQSGTWPYQQQVPNQQGSTPQTNPNGIGQQFYQQSGSTPNTSSPMMAPHAQPVRFNDHSHPNSSKVRLRAMLNTRHPTATQFNMGPTSAPGNNVNSNAMMNNNQQSGSMITSGVYQARQPQIQMMQSRPQMRPQANASQPPLNTSSSGPLHHHLSQSSNFGVPQNIPFSGNNMDSSMQQIPSNGYQNQPQQPNMMMRPQMQMGSQPMAQTTQSQFMQRSQYNVTMSQPNHSYNQQQNQQMMSGNQHWTQQNQMGAPRPPMTQLQRQLSSNQGPQNQGYHQFQ